MDREILFRGKTSSGAWVYGSLVYSAEIQPAIYYQVGKGKVKEFDWAYVDPATVGQFTGLLDKDGNKIFEGDTLDNGQAVVYQAPDFIMVPVKQVNKKRITRWQPFVIAPWEKQFQKITGTIHDNPESLEEMGE